jgi:hypothetical protein
VAAHLLLFRHRKSLLGKEEKQNVKVAASINRPCTPVAYRLTRSGLLHVGVALFQQILHNVIVPVAAGDQQRGGASGFRRYQHIQLMLWSSVQVSLNGGERKEAKH